MKRNRTQGLSDVKWGVRGEGDATFEQCQLACPQPMNNVSTTKNLSASIGRSEQQAGLIDYTHALATL